MKIVVTVPHLPLDIARNESGLCTALQKLGHEPTVITTDLGGRASSNRPWPGLLESLPYGLRILPRVPGTRINPLAFGVRDALKDCEVELIHSSEDTDLLTVAAFMASRALRVPFVLSTERYYVPKFPKSIGYGLIERTWTRHIREEAEVITTHSTIQKAYWRSRGLMREDALMIPVGVWTDLFTPGKSDFLRSTFKIPDDSTLGLTVGRMTEYKDYPSMLRAMRIVVDTDPSVYVVAVGFGPDRRKVIRLCRQLGLDANVVFPEERVPHSKMPLALRSCDFYLQTSSVEPFGIAVVEAMATATPVVATDVGGMSDTILDGIVGLKAPAGKPVLIANAILAMRDPDLRVRFGRAARDRAVSVFDWMVVARTYMEAYSRAINSKSSGDASTRSSPHARRTFPKG